MTLVAYSFIFVSVFFVHGECDIDMRLVDGANSVSNAGLLQIRTDSGFGTVCRANAAAADVICRSVGYTHGSLSTSPCGFYGGVDLCGAVGSSVAMMDLSCSGSEWSVEECSWAVPDDECAGHEQDIIVYCGTSTTAAASKGAVRLIAPGGSPAIDGEGRPEVFIGNAWTPVCSAGASSGAAGVLCKAMGFSGASKTSKCDGWACGEIAPGISELACSGSEAEPLACPHEEGDGVFCAPSESLTVSCVGDGETQGRPAKEPAPEGATSN
jgi:hypothetical protein